MRNLHLLELPGDSKIHFLPKHSQSLETASLKDPFTCLTSSYLGSTLYNALKISALIMVEINKLINPSSITLRIKLPHSVGQDNTEY